MRFRLHSQDGACFVEAERTDPSEGPGYIVSFSAHSEQYCRDLAERYVQLLEARTKTPQVPAA